MGMNSVGGMRDGRGWRGRNCRRGYGNHGRYGRGGYRSRMPQYGRGGYRGPYRYGSANSRYPGTGYGRRPPPRPKTYQRKDGTVVKTKIVEVPVPCPRRSFEEKERENSATDKGIIVSAFEGIGDAIKGLFYGSGRSGWGGGGWGGGGNSECCVPVMMMPMNDRMNGRMNCGTQ